MMFDETIKLYATSADDNHRYGDESEDDSVRLAKLVVERRTHDACRQRRLHVP